MSDRLTEYHAGIEAAIRTAFPKLKTVAAYDTDERARKITTPGALIDMDELTIDEATDDGTGRDPLTCRVTVHCVLSRSTPDVDLQVRAFAAQMLRLVRGNRFGLGRNAEKPKELTAQPSELTRPGTDGYETWAVTWQQTLRLGNSVWDGTGIIPSEVYLGIAPRIGLAHEPEYTLIDETPAP